MWCENMSLGALKEWLGDEGVPVAPHQSYGRAKVCVSGNDGKPCSLNVSPKWWERFFKEPVAEKIREHLEVKHSMRINTVHDGELHMCRACGCCLELKVHVPIQYIKKHITPEELSKMPAFCWIKKELEAT
jgi:hypothetical protein